MSYVNGDEVLSSLSRNSVKFGVENGPCHHNGRNRPCIRD